MSNDQKDFIFRVPLVFMVIYLIAIMMDIHLPALVILMAAIGLEIYIMLGRVEQ